MAHENTYQTDGELQVWNSYALHLNHPILPLFLDDRHEISEVKKVIWELPIVQPRSPHFIFLMQIYFKIKSSIFVSFDIHQVCLHGLGLSKEPPDNLEEQMIGPPLIHKMLLVDEAFAGQAWTLWP